MKTNQLHLFKTSRYLPLFITQFLGAFNDNVFKNALAVLITYKIAITASYNGINPETLVTLSAGLFILPFFLFSALAGRLSDHMDKSKLITKIKFAEVVLMCLASYGLYTESVALLLTTLFFIGVQATFFGPLKYSLLPEQLTEKELLSGNAFIEAATFLSILMGTILGGLFILYNHGELIISSLIVIIAIAGWISSWYIPKTSKISNSAKISWNLFGDTFEIIKYIYNQRTLYICILGISWFWAVGATFLAEFPPLAKNTFHSDHTVYTYFLTLFSIGIGLGSLLCNKILKGEVSANYVPLGALGMTLVTFDFYWSMHHYHFIHDSALQTAFQFIISKHGLHISLDILLVSIFGGIFTVPLYTLLQHRSDPNYRARVIAGNNIINSLFMVAAIIITALLLTIGVRIPELFLLLAIGNLCVTIYVCKLLPDVWIKAALHYTLKTLFRVEVKGIENYYSAGNRIVIISNHTSFLDAVLLSVFLPDKLTFAVNTFTSQKWWIRFFLRLVDAYPMDPTNPMALKSLVEFVRQDKKCVIFPEGRLTVTGALMKIYEGPGLVADKSGAKLLPIHIHGAQFSPFSRLRGKVKIRLFPKITVSIFPAEPISISEELKGRKRRQQIGYKLYDTMTEISYLSNDIQQTIFSSLLDAKATHGRNAEIAEDIEREPTTYQQLITRAFILGKIFAKATTPGEHVGVLIPNLTTTVLTFFALQAYCRVPAMLNFSAGIKNVLSTCQSACIKTVYTSKKFVRMAKLDDLIDALKQNQVNVVYLENLRSQVKWYHKLKGLLISQFPSLAYQLVNREHQDLLDAESSAVVLFTSGSEGTPKGVVLSHRNIQANRYQLSSCIDFTSNDKIFNALPVFHSFGLTGGLLLPILSGVKVFLYPSPLHYRIIPELCYDTNATIFFGTDTFLSGYAKYAHPYDFYSVRYVFAGAEKLKEETRVIWSQKFGVRIFEGYGATETSPVLSTNTPMQNKIGTVGRLLPTIQYELKPVPGIDKGGILVVRGPNIMKGYLLANKPGILVPTLNSTYETGDIVSVDEVGFVTILGRVKRFAKIAGEMISLGMVEQLIQSIWPEQQHAVISVPDPKKGEQLVLFTNEPSVTREAIVTVAKQQQVAELAIPRKIIILKTIPVLGTGKTDYTELKEMWNQQSETEIKKEIVETEQSSSI